MVSSKRPLITWHNGAAYLFKKESLFLNFQFILGYATSGSFGALLWTCIFGKVVYGQPCKDQNYAAGGFPCNTLWYCFSTLITLRCIDFISQNSLTSLLVGIPEHLFQGLHSYSTNKNCSWTFKCSVTIGTTQSPSRQLDTRNSFFPNTITVLNK